MLQAILLQALMKRGVCRRAVEILVVYFYVPCMEACRLIPCKSQKLLAKLSEYLMQFQKAPLLFSYPFTFIFLSYFSHSPKTMDSPIGALQNFLELLRQKNNAQGFKNSISQTTFKCPSFTKICISKPCIFFFSYHFQYIHDYCYDKWKFTIPFIELQRQQQNAKGLSNTLIVWSPTCLPNFPVAPCILTDILCLKV